MCGIVAASSSKKVTISRDKLNILFLMNESRGKDSCGFYNKNEAVSPDLRIEKYMGKVSEKVVPSNRYKETNMFIGHVRAATQAHAVNISNCHPFLFGDIVGVHNGTVKNWKILRDEYDLGDEVDMDSKVFFKYLEKYDDYKVIEELEGAANLVWTDTKDPEVMYVFKHKDRTLFRGNIGRDDKKIMYISSEKGALQSIGCTDIKDFRDQCLYTIKDGNITHTKKAIKINPRKKLSDERHAILYPPAPVRALPLGAAANKRDNDKSIADTILPTPGSNGGSEVILEDASVWIHKTYNDGTNYKLRQDWLDTVEIHEEETKFCKTRKMWIRTIHFTDGGFKEVRLGLPTFHFDPETGEVLIPLGINKRDQSNLTETPFPIDQYSQFLIDLSNRIQQPLTSLRTLAKKEGIKIEAELEQLDDVRDEINEEIGQIIVDKAEI